MTLRILPADSSKAPDEIVQKKQDQGAVLEARDQDQKAADCLERALNIW